MRNINRVVEVTDVVNKIVVREVISNFSIDMINKVIRISVDSLDDHAEVLTRESFHVSGEDYINFPSEDDLWAMVDKKRDESLNPETELI